MNGRAFAIFLKPPPTSSKSNQVPDNHAERFVSSAPQIPPTCLSFNMLPKSSPRAINKIEVGIINSSANKMFKLGVNPKSKATA